MPANPRPLLSVEEFRRQRLAFSLGEIAEFGMWISASPASELPRHANRIASGYALDCFSAATHADLTQRLEARRAELGLADASFGRSA